MATNRLLDAADRVAAAASLPTSEQGSVLRPRPGGSEAIPGWTVWEAQAAQVPVPSLRWPKSVDTYESMRRDGQVQGLLQSVFLPIRHMDWYIDPHTAPDATVQEIATDFGLPILDDEPPEDGVGIDWDDHLRLALLALAIGHRFFEETGIADPDTGRYRLRSLNDRPPQTIARSGGRIDVHASGALRSIRVPPSEEYLALHPEAIYVDLPADHLLAYVWDREGANWAGRPLLYGIYRNWLLKDELLRGDAVTKRRFSGLPVVEATQDNVSDAAHAAAAEMAMRVRSGDTAGVSMPYGTRLRLLGVEGTLPDAIASVRYHDEQMARAFMQMFAELGKVGSRALGTTLLDHYSLGVIAIANWARKSAQQLIRRVVDRNDGPGAPMPQLRFRQDDHEDITMGDLVALIDAGAIVVDDDLEAAIRDRSNLPARNPSEPGRVPPSAQQPTVVAASRARPHRHARPVAAATTPDPVEMSQADMAGLQERYQQAVDHLTSAWAGVQAAQIDQLVSQVASATTIAEVAGLTVTAAGASVLAATLHDVLAHGAQTAVDEAAAQGLTVTPPDLADAQARVTDAAGATAELLARSLAQSAASKATGLWGQGAAASDVAASVRTHLQDLSGATAAYEIAGLVTQAQNEGRFETWEQDSHPGDFYASAVNDTNTCEPCRLEDGDEFPTLAEARRDFPAGQFLGCQGGKRCRCAIVKVYAETPGQAA